jgi:hypothetical protein
MYDFLPGMVFGVVIHAARLPLYWRRPGLPITLTLESLWTCSTYRNFKYVLCAALQHGHTYLFFFLMQLELTLDDIKWAIVRAKKLKIKPEVK